MFEKSVYINRRYQLKNIIGNGLLLFLGNSESPMNYADNTYRFRQDSTFLYFFGIDAPNFAAVIDIDNDKEIVFGVDADINSIIWTGKQPSVLEIAQKAGVGASLPLQQLPKVINNAMGIGQIVHYLPPYRAESKLWLSDLFDEKPAIIEQNVSLDLINACIALRSVKEPCEIVELEKQMDIAYQMHVTAMQMAQPGRRESEIAGAIEGISLSAGGMVSFPIICSVRGETLHNHQHGNILSKGDLLLVDAGSESPLHYATDHTRTSPVGGMFTNKQREIYQVVLNAANAANEAIAPGIPYHDVHFAAAREIVCGLQNIGLMKGDVDEILAEGAHALFFPHGIGHMLGLDVHDMEDYNDTLVGYDNEFKRSTQFGLRSLRLGRRLQPGFVATNEPGIYFIPDLINLWQSQNKFADFINYNKVSDYIGFGGIRLEDDILVTRSGSRLLGKRIPIDPAEVEKMVQSGQ